MYLVSLSHFLRLSSLNVQMVVVAFPSPPFQPLPDPSSSAPCSQNIIKKGRESAPAKKERMEKKRPFRSSPAGKHSQRQRHRRRLETLTRLPLPILYHGCKCTPRKHQIQQSQKGTTWNTFQNIQSKYRRRYIKRKAARKHPPHRSLSPYQGHCR